MLTPEHSPRDIPSPSHEPESAARPQRVLACVLCQQRKVKCDRKTPCNNCTKSGVECVSAAVAPRQRRRRFAEKELLDRLRHYEGLLRQNAVSFEPLHPDALGDNGSRKATDLDHALSSQDARREPSLIHKTK
jgi:hypothetical protein